MSGIWRSCDIYLAAGMARSDTGAELRHRVLLMAADSGEFVQSFRIVERHPQRDGWIRWTVSYLTGPPRIGRPLRELTLVKASRP